MQLDEINNMSMLDLFKMEVASQSLTITEEMGNLATLPPPVESIHTILRAMHSVKGAAAIINLHPIVDLMKETEKVLSTYDATTSNHGRFIACLGDIVQFLGEMSQQKNEAVTNWLAGKQETLTLLLQTVTSFDPSPPKQAAPPPPPSAAGTIQPAEAIESPEADESIPRLDGSMFAIFKEDALGHSANLSDNLLRLENTPNDLRAIESSMRSTHSIKGAARVIGLPYIVELAHAMEEVFMASQSGTVLLNSDTIDMLLAALDFLNEVIAVDEEALFSWFENNKKRANRLIKTLETISNLGQEDGFSEEHDENPEFPEEPGSGEAAALIPAVSPLAKPRPKPRKKEVSDNDHLIKVSANGLNRLMGLTSEMMVESKWHPSLLTKSYEIKRVMDTLLKQMEAIRKSFHESHFDQYIEQSFKELHKQELHYRTQVTQFVAEIEDHTRSSNETAHRLHKEVVNNRMQPFSEGIKEFPRMVRDTARKLNKEITLEIEGAETLVDRDILERIKSPLTHLVSNAIDHGVEDVTERLLAGKPGKATIRIEAKHLFGVLQISISDDGRGIDPECLRKTIIDKNLVPAEIASELTEPELLDFLFLPNFSTRETTNHMSGRGVGLDVVQETVREIRGSVKLSSIKGAGAIFDLQLPLTLSVSRCLIAYINNEVYGFPLVRTARVTKISPRDILELGGHQYFIDHDKRIGLIFAQQVLDLTVQEAGAPEYTVIILQNVAKSYGIIVDRVTGIKELMVQPLASRLGKMRSVSAAAIGDDGTPILILDTQDLVQSMDHLISGDRLHAIDSIGKITHSKGAKNILVVDDSATVREVERKLLSDHGYVVTTAIDGVDGWQKAQSQDFDLIITDIDMPHMDGIELVLQIKDSDRFESMPIIIVSYKNREEDRIRGLDAGADYYLTKGSFQDQTLLDAVNDLIGPANDHG